MWVVMLMRRVWVGAKLLKRDGVIMCGLLEHVQGPHEVLSDGLACAAAVIGSYQAVPGFLDV